MAIRILSPKATLEVRRSNFLDKAPLELHPGRPFDLRENYWGSKSPNLQREVQFVGNAKQGNAEQGDALLEPVLKEAARAGAPELD
ncbi:MAG: hypothetical protein GY711_18795 [bacterium]|nr:hypothetical protein [bacterium]